MVQNNVAAEKSRKTSRLSKGLNPDVPRPVNQAQRKIYLIFQLHQKMKKRQKIERQMRRHHRFRKWTSIESHSNNSAIGQELVLRSVILLFNLGLTTQQATKRNIEEGDNKLPEKKKEPGWLRFLKEITNWFAIMLWVGSILCIVIYIIQPQGNLPNLYLAFVLMFVVLLTGAITYAQGAKS